MGQRYQDIDWMLPPRCGWGLRSSVMLYSEVINTDIWQVSCEEGRRQAGELGRVAGFDRNGYETFNFTAGKKSTLTPWSRAASQILYLFSKSRNSLQFTKPVSSLPYSQLSTTLSHTKVCLCSSLPPTHNSLSLRSILMLSFHPCLGLPRRPF